MCGICGGVSSNGTIPIDWIESMLKHIRQRGPDAFHIEHTGDASLAHSRLSVIDLTSASNQPMWDASGRFLISYNGEIYNYKEVKKELENNGFCFKTSGDTEVLLNAFIHWGEECFSHLNGMFAFAVWDQREKRLFLARDRMGQKPLYYAQMPDGSLVFSSEFQSIQSIVKKTSVNRVALAKYLLCNYFPGTETIESSISSLEPGCFVWYSKNGLSKPKSYWSLETYLQNKSTLTFSQASEQLTTLIDDAVDLCTRADVTVGCLLSGGVDSSTVLASLNYAEREDVACFSIGFEQDDYNETKYAGNVASHFGHQLHCKTMAVDTRDLKELVSWMGTLPLADTSCFPMHKLCEFTKKSATVALTGDGADELFAGYPTYKADRLATHLRYFPKSLLKTAYHFANWFLPHSFDKVSFDYKLRKFLGNVHLDRNRAHAAWRSIFNLDELNKILTPEFTDSIKGFDLFDDFMLSDEINQSMDPLDASLLVDCKTWLCNDILIKSDRTSMAHGLELRAPFLDHRIVEFSAALPASYKMKASAQKVILKDSQKHRLPEWVLHRKKEGFNAPLAHWLNDELCAVLKEQIDASNMYQWIKPDFVEGLFMQQKKRVRDNSLKILSLATLTRYV